MFSPMNGSRHGDAHTRNAGGVVSRPSMAWCRTALVAALLSTVSLAATAQQNNEQAQQNNEQAQQDNGQAQQDSEQTQVGELPLATFKLEREAAEARDRERLAGLVDDSEALAAALADAQQRRDAARAERERLESDMAETRAALDEISAARDAEGGDLTAVFSAVAGATGELRDELGQSWLTLGAETALPPRLDDEAILTVQHIEALADSLMGMTAETAKVRQIEAPVAASNGEVASRPVTRVGDLMAFSQGELLERVGEEGRLAAVEHTPTAVRKALTAYQAGESANLPVDPADGRVVEALSRQPSLVERFHQGGAVGYVVVALGVLGLLVAVGQYLYLLRVSVTTRRQLSSMESLRSDNPLGRVLSRFHAFGADHAPEALEARLDECLLAEQPRLERGQALVKMLAAVAPLLGLLGTVTGMIVTFQSITVFGTGDPQLMAGGISQALVTTVLGLITAVPLLFAHTALSSRSRSLIGTMEGKASAVLADRLETRAAPVSGTSTQQQGSRQHADSPLA
ncbi:MULTISPECIES: MotA/TolQ/ExbB proton channel family protein [unclassified Halomonas]|uniref:MotA/TolQ/ExbB proton channel family protein n=1 Tax=unclassified Halomonas TaxID=2609666 RepID=UPI0021BBF6E6|nr:MULTISPECIES: MotA/TolQ/ExbB proton channel family protein [unclassified Halomonas]MED5296830.1 MotA/TolQ/ExbB proton channel family protein [Pseudomonadota bacterium]